MFRLLGLDLMELRDPQRTYPVLWDDLWSMNLGSLGDLGSGLGE